MKQIQQYLFLLLVSISILSCNKKEEIVTKNGTELEITIQDENKDIILDEIDVYLFSDENAYINSLLNEEPLGYDYQGKSTNEGIALFSNIEPKQYYIYISYEGKGYTLNNFFSYQQLENVLIADATTSIIVKLSPFNIGSLGFWTSEHNLDNLEIEIWVKDSLIGTLPGVSTSKPTDLEDNQILPIFYQEAGTFVWQAKGKNGCYWSGEVTLGVNETQFIELTSCSAGKFSFWTRPAVINAHQKLTIVVNETEIVGEITTGQNTTPTTCENSSTSQVIINKPLGSYNYKVLSTDQECVWIGTFVINQDCSGAIEIENCEE